MATTKINDIAAAAQCIGSGRVGVWVNGDALNAGTLNGA